MPKTIIRLNLFLSSPYGLDKEKDIVTSIIQELNHESSSIYHLEIQRWEELTPTATKDKDVQAYINEKINDYDIYLGILWDKFGTPTKRAASGTEEEFNLAYERFKARKEHIAILVYFKSDDMDVVPLLPEAQKVIDFKNRLKSDGVLYKNFSLKSKSKFRNDVKKHIDASARDIVTQTLTKEKNLENIHKMLIDGGAGFSAARRDIEYDSIRLFSYKHNAIIEKKNLTNIISMHGINSSDQVLRSIRVVSEASTPTEEDRMSFAVKNLLNTKKIHTNCESPNNSNVKSLDIHFAPPLAPKEEFHFQFSFTQRDTMFHGKDFVTSSHAYEEELDNYQQTIEFKDKPPKFVDFQYYDENKMQVVPIKLFETYPGSSRFEIEIDKDKYSLVRRLHCISVFTREK